MLKHYPLLPNTKTWKHTYTHTACTNISLNLALFIDKNKAISLVCFIALPEYRKIVKNMLLLDWCYDAKPFNKTKHRCLSQVGQSTTWWWKKMLLLWLNFKAWGKHLTIWLWCATVKNFSYILSNLYFPSEWVSIFFLFSAVCEVLTLMLWLDSYAWREHFFTLLDR